MIRLFRRAPAMRAGRQVRVFLRLEDLEGRATPSGGAPPITSPPPAGQTPVPAVPANQAPQIVDFAAEELANGLFVFTGQVIDANPGGLTITFGGSVGTMAGVTCTTDPNGYFSEVIQLRTDGTDVGWVSASTVDGNGLASNVPWLWVHPTPP